MRKILSLLIIAYLIGFLVTPCLATDYYAQADGNIDTATMWDTTPAGGGTDLTWTGSHAGDTFYANNHAIAVNVSFTATKISTAAGAGTAGGSFNVATSVTPLTVTAKIGAGTTPCLVITGNANANPALTVNAGTDANSIQGGSAGAAYGISDSHTVGTVVVTGNPTGGTNSTARGYYFSGASGVVAITGNATGSSATAPTVGVYTAANGTMTITGNCVGGTYSAAAYGCHGADETGSITVTGNLIYGDAGANPQNNAPPIAGNVVWTPGALNYVKFTPGTDVYASQTPGCPYTGTCNGSKIASGTNGVNTQDGSTLAGTSSGGGGAWAY
jgi:hypothetical protein